MNILITGGGGFIGSHLTESQLLRGHKVRVLDMHPERLSHLSDHPNLEIIAGDITKAEPLRQAIDGIDVIYHLASAHLEISVPDAYYREVNVLATKKLLEAARANGVKRVVHCSSVGVFGKISSLPADETSPCNPTTIYEQTKLAGERLALQFSAESGLPVVVARPAWVYGPRCPRTHKLISTIRKGRFIVLGNGRTLRHPIFVSDAVRGLELCAEADGVEGRVFILAGPEPVTIETLVREVAKVTGVHPPAMHLPAALGISAGLALEILCRPFGVNPPFSRRSADFFLKDNSYDISNARRCLGFRPLINLVDGLTMTVAQSRSGI